MEIAILFIFLSAYIFQNNRSMESETEIVVIGIIFSSQFLIMVMTISKGVKDLLLKYKENKNKINNRLPTNANMIIEKNASNIALSSSNPDFLDKNKGMKENKTNIRTNISGIKGIKEEIKESGRKNSDGVVSPMRYISEFEEMGDDKNLNDKIAAVHKKFFDKTEIKKNSKKSKLRKLLHKMNKNKQKRDKTREYHEKEEEKKAMPTATPKDLSPKLKKYLKPEWIKLGIDSPLGKEKSDNNPPPKDAKEIHESGPDSKLQQDQLSEIDKIDNLSLFSSIPSKSSSGNSKEKSKKSDENPKQLSEINKDDKSVSLPSSDEKPSDNSQIESNSENESKNKEMEEVEKTKEIKPEDPTLNPDLEMAQPKQDE